MNAASVTTILGFGLLHSIWIGAIAGAVWGLGRWAVFVGGTAVLGAAFHLLVRSL